MAPLPTIGVIRQTSGVPCVPPRLDQFDWSFNGTGPLPLTPGVWCIISTFTALALWSTIHLLSRIFFFFKHYHGLYFWSLVITSLSLSIRAIGFLLRWVAHNVPWQFSLYLVEVGWIGMVTGFSIVLWSRLNIIVLNVKILRYVLIMIIVNGVVFHSALVILQYGLAAQKGDPVKRAPWLKVLNPFERVQITMFTVQEFIITCIYIHAAYKLLVDRLIRQPHAIRNVLLLLFCVQLGILMMDVVVIAFDLAGFFTLKAVLHSWVYGIKLELEFVVLNQLVDIAKSGTIPSLSPTKDDNVTDSHPSQQNDNSIPESQRTVTSQPPLATPNSLWGVERRHDWWPPTSEDASALSENRQPFASIDGTLSPRSSVTRNYSNSGLTSIREDETLRTLSLDSIGVIPDVEDSPSDKRMNLAAFLADG